MIGEELYPPTFCTQNNIKKQIKTQRIDNNVAPFLFIYQSTYGRIFWDILQSYIAFVLALFYKITLFWLCILITDVIAEFAQNIIVIKHRKLSKN